MIVRKVYINEDNYPLLLKKIKQPPNPLYYSGNLNLAQSRCVAVVGSRKATSYGSRMAEKLAHKLAERGISVVSGMAKGIDSCAHTGALTARSDIGGTIAVLGCGIDVCYPAVNRELRDQIVKQGLLLSEYPPGTQPAKYMFPRRNRIISGLSEATVVVQAANSSGALITAEMAAEQGREVYAVPGNIDSPYHLGSNKLIRDGAVPLIILDDLLEDLGVGRNKIEDVEKALGKEEALILSLLREHGEMTAEQLCDAAKKPVPFINGLITILEIKGVICTSLGKIFIAK